MRGGVLAFLLWLVRGVLPMEGEVVWVFVWITGGVKTILNVNRSSKTSIALPV